MSVSESVFDSLMDSILRKTKIGRGIRRLNKAIGDLEISALEATKSKIDDAYREDLISRGVEVSYLEAVKDAEGSILNYKINKNKRDEIEEKEGEEVSKLEKKKSEEIVKTLKDSIGEISINKKSEVSQVDKIERLENDQRWDVLFDKIDSTKMSMDDYFKKRLSNDDLMIKNIKEINEKSDVVKKEGSQTSDDVTYEGGGLLDFLPDMDLGGDKNSKSPKTPGKGGKLAKFLGRVAKGAGKIVAPITAAMALWDGITSGSDDEAIKARTGKEEVSIGDRIKQGVAGAAAGLVNWIPRLGDINASNSADWIEKSINFVTGNGLKTDRELGESGVSDDKSLIETLVSASPIGMAVNELRGEGVVKSLIGGSVKDSNNVRGREVKAEQIGGRVKDSSVGVNTSNQNQISSIVNNTYNTTNVSQEVQPRFRITDESTRALSVLGG